MKLKRAVTLQDKNILKLSSNVMKWGNQIYDTISSAY